MKDVLAAAGVPTAAHRAFGAGEVEAAVAFLDELPGLYVVKTDGLAAGKGVLVTESLVRGRGRRPGQAVRAGLRRRRPPRRHRGGHERPRGLAAVPLRRRRGRRRWRRPRTSSASATATGGPNTGGMGAYSPVPGRRRRRG